MPDTLYNALRNRLSRSPRLVRHLQDLHVLSGLDCTVVDPLGTPLLTLPRNSTLALCRTLRKSEKAARACARCQSCLRFQADGSVATEVCAGGLREILHRMVVDGQPVAFLLLSGYRDPDTGVEDARRAWIHSAREGGSVSWKEWLHAWEKTPALGAEKVEALRRWMGIVTQDTLRHLEQEPAIRDQAIPVHVHKACQLIREHHAEPLRLGDIADRCGVSPEYLSRLFHQTTGLRFREYLTETRLNHACEYLAETDERVADIAEKVGYSTLSRFNRGFRDHTGMTPTAYRRRKRIIR